MTSFISSSLVDDSRDSDRSLFHQDIMTLRSSYVELSDRSIRSSKEFFNPANDIVTVNKDCFVKILLGSVVLGTAFALIVIAVSAKGKHDNHLLHSQSMMNDVLLDVHWATNQSGQPRMMFRHQYLIRDIIRRDGFAQIMALDETAQVYIIEILNERVQYYKQYIVVNIEKGTQTFLLVSRDKNKISSKFIEKTVLLCLTEKIPGHRKAFVRLASLGQSSVFQSKLHKDIVDMEYIYVGDWMTASPFLSIVVNSSCHDLPESVLFDWGKVDESVACGSNISMKTVSHACPGNICNPLKDIPLTRLATCHTFRRCNFILDSCYSLKQEAQIRSNQPFCACRRAAAADALHLSCPGYKDDGGECEYPRRDLYSAQRTLPCQCQYTFSVIFPLDANDHQEENLSGETKRRVIWEGRLESKIAPAVNFRKCLC